MKSRVRRTLGRDGEVVALEGSAVDGTMVRRDPAACCSVCGPCVIATVTGLTMEVVGSCSAGQALPRVEKAQETVRTSSASSSVALVAHGPGESGCQAILGSSARGAKPRWR